MRPTSYFLLVLGALLASFSLKASPRPAPIFGSHMVLQRDKPIKIWGLADPGEKIEVQFNGQKKRCRADGSGHWRLTLKKEKAGGPYSMTIIGNSTVSLEDVLVGDVWICSGQSNMEWVLAKAANGDEEVAAADFPKIRHIEVPNRTAIEPQIDIEPAPWRPCTPEYAGDFSAVGYFFARKIFQETGIPIGLVNASWGGTHCETWTSRKAIAKNKALLPALARLPVSMEAYEKSRRQVMNQMVNTFQGPQNGNETTKEVVSADFSDKNWPDLQVPKAWEEQGLPDFDGIVWFRRHFTLSESQAQQPARLLIGMIDDCDTSYLNGIQVGASCVWDESRVYALPVGALHAGDNLLAVKVTDWGGGGGFYGNPKLPRLVAGTDTIDLTGTWKACIERRSLPVHLDPNSNATLLFNGMIHPLLQLGIRGAIWYQGESNVDRAAQYAHTFPEMIKDWRRQWKQGRFPFYFVQLAAFLPPEKNSLKGSPWAELRDAQRQALSLPHTGMAVATDIGDALDIHPRNKQDVGLRLALNALKNEYGKNLECSGPVFRSMRVEGREVVLKFDHAGKELVVKNKYRYLFGFSIAGADQQFHWATAAWVKGDEVHAYCDQVPNPVAVRYGWVDNPEEGNLYNSEGLPASPFRTDKWKLVTEGVGF